MREIVKKDKAKAMQRRQLRHLAMGRAFKMVMPDGSMSGDLFMRCDPELGMPRDFHGMKMRAIRVDLNAKDPRRQPVVNLSTGTITMELGRTFVVPHANAGYVARDPAVDEDSEFEYEADEEDEDETDEDEDD